MRSTTATASMCTRMVIGMRVISVRAFCKALECFTIAIWTDMRFN
jgi:hypothetical protein